MTVPSVAMYFGVACKRRVVACARHEVPRSAGLRRPGSGVGPGWADDLAIMGSTLRWVNGCTSPWRCVRM